MANDLPLSQTGLVTLDQGQLQVVRRLDDIFRAAALASQARDMGFPPLSSVASLRRIDYFRNFPHLGLAVAPLRSESLGAVAEREDATEDSLDSAHMEAPRYFLPSAACYPIYAHLRDSQLMQAARFTTVQRCFRNEEEYEGLARLMAFTMREVVIVGVHLQTIHFLAEYKNWIQNFAERVGLDLVVRPATDPFFEADGARAKMQQLFPVKEEFVFQGQVAVASLNLHRNFFGQRWNIRSVDGQLAFSACVAFGLERWLHALTLRYDNDVDAVLAILAA
jgi:seryl-tRNA synthetase